MRVVSLVPSWTETLLGCGVDVVGRTRWCVHPAGQVDTIPIVGGTKDVRVDDIVGLRPDLVVLDEEENPREAADALTAAGVPWHATAVRHVDHVAPALDHLGVVLGAPKLAELAETWRTAITHRRPVTLEHLPGVLRWASPPPATARQVVYLIWRGPWMAVGPDTYIGSVLGHLGVAIAPLPAGRYPHVDLSALDPAETVLLLSSEPFPFAKFVQDPALVPFGRAVVDGEAYGWFGVRGLKVI